MLMITFIHNGKKFELQPNKKGNYDVVCPEEHYKACVVGFNETRGFMKGSTNGAWEREEILEIALKAIKAYWANNERKEGAK